MANFSIFFPDLKSRPTKEILEFSPRDSYVPNYQVSSQNFLDDQSSRDVTKGNDIFNMKSG